MSSAISTKPSVNKIVCCSYCPSGSSCQVAFSMASPILVLKPWELIFCALVFASSRHCLSTVAGGISMFTHWPKVQTPALAPSGIISTIRFKAGMRRLSGSFCFIEPEISIMTRTSLALLVGIIVLSAPSGSAKPGTLAGTADAKPSLSVVCLLSSATEGGEGCGLA